MSIAAPSRLPATSGYADARHTRRRVAALVIVVATVAAISIAYLAEPVPGIATALATSALAAGTAALYLVYRPSPLDTTFVFMGLFVAYYVAMPLVYVTGIAPISGANFLNGDWNVLTRANLIGELGLIAYGVGLRLVASRRPRTSPERVRRELSPAAGRWLVLALLALGAISFAIMWIREGHPFGVFLGQPPQARARISAETAGGFGYFIELTFAVNLAVFVQVLLHPRRSLLSPSVLGLFVAAFWADSLLGSRLMLVMTWIAALLIRRALQHPRTGSVAGAGAKDNAAPDAPGTRWLPILLASIALFVVATAYTSYRIGQSPTTSSIEYTALNTFDTSTGYYLVLTEVPSRHPYWGFRTVTTPFLQLVPSAIMPGKYNAMYSDARFTYEFYGYDQNQNGTVARGADLLAEAYLNGGVFGVVAIMGLSGALNEAMARRMRRTKSAQLFIVVYIVYLLFYIPFAEKDGAISGITFVDVKLLAFGLVAWFVTRVFVPAHGQVAPATR